MEAVRLGFFFRLAVLGLAAEDEDDDSVTYCDTKVNMMIKRRYSTIIIVKVRWRVSLRIEFNCLELRP